MKEETLGEVFKRYRKAEGKKIERIEDELKISKRMLLALENNDFKSLPNDLYTKNIIKTYAKYLDLDYNKLLNLYEKKRQQFEQGKEPEQNKEKVKVYITPKIIKIVLISLLIIALLVYLGFQIEKIFKAPQLIILQPEKNEIISQNFIEIKGKTEKEASVFINGKEIFLDSNGEFKASLDLQKGLNLIKISAVKKHSRENTIFREILVQ